MTIHGSEDGTATNLLAARHFATADDFLLSFSAEEPLVSSSATGEGQVDRRGQAGHGEANYVRSVGIDLPIEWREPLMNAERWRRVEEIYHEASARPSSEREAFLADVCGTDNGLRADVQSLSNQEGRSEMKKQRVPVN